MFFSNSSQVSNRPMFQVIFAFQERFLIQWKILWLKHFHFSINLNFFFNNQQYHKNSVLARAFSGTNHFFDIFIIFLYLHFTSADAMQHILENFWNTLFKRITFNRKSLLAIKSFRVAWRYFSICTDIIITQTLTIVWNIFFNLHNVIGSP